MNHLFIDPMPQKQHMVMFRMDINLKFYHANKNLLSTGKYNKSKYFAILSK
jgi:hypothetical protein